MTPLRQLRRLIVLAGMALVAAPLAACYVSDDPLLNADEAVHPLADGVYGRQGDPRDRLRLTQEPDGWYSVERLDPSGILGETHRVLAVPSEAGLILAEADAPSFTYGIARVQGGRLYVAAPDCADPLDRGDAQDQGASGDDDNDFGHFCRFRSSQALERALASFAGHADFGAPYIRVNPAPGA